ncbi:MAG: hypothetical protein KIT43_12800 [Bauldia sp.]|nr:hypothetical protein [Bauldia sp.]
MSGATEHIVADGERRAEERRQGALTMNVPVSSHIKFVGVGYVTCGAVRDWQFCDAEARYSPLAGDTAHSNIVFFGLENPVRSAADLARQIHVVEASDLAKLPIEGFLRRREQG